MATSSGLGTDQPAFPRTGFGTRGYCCAEVDRFVAHLRAAMRQEPPTITAGRVACTRFHVGRFCGTYAMPAVDAYLDDAEADLRARGAVGDSSEKPAPNRHRSGAIAVYVVAAILVALILGLVLAQL